MKKAAAFPPLLGVSAFLTILCQSPGALAEIPVESPRQTIVMTGNQPWQGESLQSGIWGTLETRERIIEAPTAIARDFPMLRNWEKGTVWSFRGSRTALTQLLRRAGLEETLVDELTSPPVLTDLKTHLEVRPDEKTILGLSNDARLEIYSHIGFPTIEDPYYYTLQFIPGGIPRMGPPPKQISPELIDLARRLSYSDLSGNIFFSDTHFLLRKTDTEEQKVELARFLTRELAEQAWLNVPRSRDRYREILQYWESGGRNPNVTAVLSAAFENQNQTRLELEYLLPPGPRKYLNTYPSREESNVDRYPNCFATAFSFFSEDIPPRYFDSPEPDLRTNYIPGKPPWQLGDVIVIYDTTGEWKHVCNYIAGNLVFTKNGNSPDRPWVIQKLDDVLTVYLMSEKVHAKFYRLKPGLFE